MPVTLHDGSRIILRKAADDYDTKSRSAAWSYIQDHREKGEIVTGLLYIEDSARDMHGDNNSVDRPLNNLPYSELCPGRAALDDLFEANR